MAFEPMNNGCLSENSGDSSPKMESLSAVEEEDGLSPSLFVFVSKPQEETVFTERVSKRFPLFSVLILGLIGFGCLFAELLMNHDPTFLDLSHTGEAPGKEFYFGTDFLGRDIYSMIWAGGRTSLLIGFLAAAISAVIALLYGGISGWAPWWLDRVMMRFADLLLSIPSILLVIFLGGIFSASTPVTLALMIGFTGWVSMAKLVRTQVLQLKKSEYLLAARSMGAGFFYLLRRHLLPNLLPSVLFMMVTNIGTAVASEATLSFLGIGLPAESVSWGAMLSQADRALLTNSWWMIVIPGLFLTAVLLSVMGISNYLRKEETQRCSNFIK